MKETKDKQISRLKVMMKREKYCKLICAELNNFVDLKDSLGVIINHVRELTMCAACGIRLCDNGDFPYYVFDGFSDSFIRHENSLCVKDHLNRKIPDLSGNGYLLECMCGNVISGRFDPELSFFTKKGSFWTNSTSRLLETTNPEELQGELRNFCHASGYESVALIPIRFKGERIGLIQVNDKREGMFDQKLIEYLEMIAEQVGISVQNSLIHTRLKEAFMEIKVLRGIIPICSSCKRIRDDRGFWQQVESYIGEHSEADFTHSICPQCAKKLYPDLVKD